MILASFFIISKSMKQNLNDSAKNHLCSRASDMPLYFMRPGKDGRRSRRCFSCRDCGKVSETDPSKSRDGGASRRCNACIKLVASEGVQRSKCRHR